MSVLRAIAGTPAADAIAARLILAVDPAAVGGIVLTARSGPARDLWLEQCLDLVPASAPRVRVPHHIADDRLLGGLDLAATLSAGRPVADRGVLADADGGVAILTSAERLPAGAAARIAAILDAGEVTAARDGLDTRHPARFAVLALDEGIDGDEHVPAALIDRLGLAVRLDRLRASDLTPRDAEAEHAAVAAARLTHHVIALSDDVVSALCGTAAALGIHSARAPMLAARVARILAALDGATIVTDDHAAHAARLVLAPRARHLPAPPDEQPEEPPPPPAEEPPPDDQTSSATDPDPVPLEDVILAAVAAALPPDLLAATDRQRTPSASTSAGRADAKSASRTHGRQVGVHQGLPGRGARLDLVATLRAAAPWQRLRGPVNAGRVHVRRDDLRLRRLEQRTETTTIFVVDASGSSAIHRLAEAKGAVELLLADAYVRRDRVALISFRGKAAEVLLPPTRALALAKRRLAGAPGGGGTPLASGLDAATSLVRDQLRRAQIPTVVVLTDGRANIALDGRADRASAMSDAEAAARRLRATGARAILIDTSPQPDPKARRIADAMAAQYLPLPLAQSSTISAAVKAILAAPSSGRAA